MVAMTNAVPSMKMFGIIVLSLAVAQPSWAQNAANKTQSAPKATAKAQTKAKKAEAPAKKPVAKAKKVKAKKAKAAPKPPAKPSPAVTAAYAAMPVAERMAIQNDLMWTGDYNGGADGDFGENSLAAVRSFQRNNNSRETGLLTPAERAALAAAAKAKRDAAGWRLVDDPETGIRLGLPGRLVPNALRFRNGHRWSSARGEVQVETFRISGPGTTLADAFEQQKTQPANREVSYSVMQDDFFVVSGLQGLKKFYVRAHGNDREVRGITILYDQAMAGTLDPIAVAMSSTFGPFPSSQFPGPAKVEYGTAIVVDSRGYLLASHAVTDGCYAITVSGVGRADRLAEDEAAGLALLRVYGVQKLAPAVAGEGPAEGETTLAGIADPRLQGGAEATTIVRARLNGSSGVARVIEPTPAVGFSGAAVLDGSGRLIGMSTLTPSVVAGPPIATSQAALVPIDAIRRFLSARGIALAGSGAPGIEAAKAAIHRVICVRK